MGTTIIRHCEINGNYKKKRKICVLGYYKFGDLLCTEYQFVFVAIEFVAIAILTINHNM